MPFKIDYLAPMFFILLFRPSVSLQHSLMKMRIYTTSVISRGIYTPKVFFSCICDIGLVILLTVCNIINNF